MTWKLVKSFISQSVRENIRRCFRQTLTFIGIEPYNLFATVNFIEIKIYFDFISIQAYRLKDI